MMIIYAAFTFVLLMSGAKYFALIFVDPSETEILLDTELFLHISCMFFPVLGLLCVLRYTIQGVGFTNLAMFSGVAEMIARILVSLYAVPAFGFLAVCCGLVPCSCFYLCLQEVEEAGAYKRFGYASGGIGVAGLRNRREVSLVSDIAGCRFRLLQSILLRLHWRMLRSFRQ